VAAAAFVLVVIATGWLLAAAVGAGRVSALERQWSHQQAAWQSVQLRQAQVRRWVSMERCAAFRRAFLGSAESLGGLRRRLDGSRFIELRQAHARLTLAHWEPAVTLRKTCGSTLPPVLYLYSGTSCPECLLQTRIFRIMERRHHPQLQVLPVDVDVAPPEQVHRLRQRYGVTRLPTSIIAETRHEGFLPVDRLELILTEDRRDEGVLAYFPTLKRKWQISPSWTM
jgi:hypothetical protein